MAHIRSVTIDYGMNVNHHQIVGFWFPEGGHSLGDAGAELGGDIGAPEFLSASL
jgi:hypothetical protein